MDAPEGGGAGRRIYTRGGDDGSTGLLYGGRVSKDHPRIEACGSIDEAVAALGLARAFKPAADGLSESILEIQRQLFVVGAELAASEANSARLQEGVSKVSEEMISLLERQIDRMVKMCPLPDYFVVPGNTQAAAALDLARGLVRRAERRVVRLTFEAPQLHNRALRYLNRLSDLLFVAARLEESSRDLSAPPSRTFTPKGRPAE